MDPHNFNPFDPGWRDMYHAMLERQQAGQEDFEQNLDRARRADSAPIAAAPPPLDRYPHLSHQDRSLIEAAIKAEAEHGTLKEKTCLGYAIALRKLGNDLGSRGQTIDALDHNSLVAHAEQVFPRVTAMRPALAAVRKYREPDASADERRYELSADDKSLIDAAVRAGAERHGWKSTSAQNYAGVLQRLANSLGPGQTIAALGHNSLLAHANKSFPNNRPMKAALTALREYRELGEATRGAGGSGQAEGQTIPSPVQVSIQRSFGGRWIKPARCQPTAGVRQTSGRAALQCLTCQRQASINQVRHAGSTASRSRSWARHINRLTRRLPRLIYHCASPGPGSMATNGRRQTSLKECACTTSCRTRLSRRQISPFTA